MRKILIVVICAIAVDAFFWDFTLTILPFISSKRFMALFGAAAFFFKGVRKHNPSFSRRVIVSAFLALVFSLWCYIAITLNGTDDTIYVTYFGSFATWLAAAYGVYTVLRYFYGKVDLMLITRYIAIVCVAQCIIAMLIHNVPAVNRLFNPCFCTVIIISKGLAVSMVLDVRSTRPV